MRTGCMPVTAYTRNVIITRHCVLPSRLTALYTNKTTAVTNRSTPNNSLNAVQYLVRWLQFVTTFSSTNCFLFVFVFFAPCPGHDAGPTSDDSMVHSKRMCLWGSRWWKMRNFIPPTLQLRRGCSWSSWACHKSLEQLAYWQSRIHFPASNAQ